MATGQRAFDRPSSLETMMAILKEDPSLLRRSIPRSPERLNAIITRCLAKDPKDRYWTTKNLASDLKELASGVQSAADRPASPRRSRPTRAGLVTVRRRPPRRRRRRLLPDALRRRRDRFARRFLPFETTSPEPDAAYLGQGIADNLIQRLSSLPNLRVISRSSVSRYRGQAVDPQKAARELKVRAVLTGTVIQRGDRLNVTAELVDARRNAHLWGKQYDRRFDDILTLQEEISRDVSAELRPQRAPEKAPVANRGATTVADAYRSYLKGRYHWNKRTEADARRAIAYFQEAIERDPSYADAYDGLCDAWTTLGWYGFVPPTEAYPRAQAAARKAIEIDETVAEAHASLGGIELWFGWNWSVAEREFARTLELDPNYAPGRHWHADLFSIRGRHDEAIAESRKALELDPLSLIINTWLARRYYFARRLEDAERECRRALELDPNFPPARWQLGSCSSRRESSRKPWPSSRRR
jgi:TolB-like protein/Tfp pilus assembly protein PilF